MIVSDCKARADIPNPEVWYPDTLVCIYGICSTYNQRNMTSGSICTSCGASPQPSVKGAAGDSYFNSEHSVSPP